MVHLKLFCPWNQWMWFITEGEQQGNDFIFFGYVIGHAKEWGDISVPDGRRLFVHPGYLLRVQAHRTDDRSINQLTEPMPSGNGDVKSWPSITLWYIGLLIHTIYENKDRR